MRRLFPHPWLSLALAITWILLANRLSPGHVVLAAILATVIPWLTAAYWPQPTALRRPDLLAAYVALVLWDILRANLAVARIVLFAPDHEIRSAWVTVPLDLTSPEAIALLSGTITLTPGTLVADMSGCGRVLLVHCLHAPDPEAVRDEIKTRYEARLKRIFA